MLEKNKVFILVDKLISILLIEADFNMAEKIVGSRTIKKS